MSKKLFLVLGFAIGYVFGSRAGYERYEQIMRVASRIRRFPIVSKPIDRTGERIAAIVRRQGDIVTDKVVFAVKERLFGVSEPYNYAEVDLEIEDIAD